MNRPTVPKAEFEEIGRKHPFPWQEITYQPFPKRPDVLVTMLDARGVEVPLFAMTAFMQYMTTQFALRAQAAAQPAAPQATAPAPTPENP